MLVHLISLKEKVLKLPKEPGIYLMRDKLGAIIYVGKANHLKSRLLSYFRRGNTPTPKTARMMKEVREIEVILLKSEEEALIFECRTIKEFQPKYNILFKDDKSYPFVKVTLNESIPRFLISRMKKPDGALYLGPFTDVSSLRKALDCLNRSLKIRTCRVAQPKEKEYKHCLYQMMKWCSAPCVNKISINAYRKSVDIAVQVFMGRSHEILKRLKNDMIRASKALNYELAAQIRDGLSLLETMVGTRVRSIRKIKRLSHHVNLELVDLKHALGLEKKPQIIEAFDISHFSGKQSVGSMVHFNHGRPDKRFYRHFKIKTVEGIDDFRMMKEIVSRRFAQRNTSSIVTPDLIVIDGGKIQLKFAFQALTEAGLDTIPIIGLAKKYEEIHTLHSQSPIRLSHDAYGLHLLQRIRDEAHRFAISFHRSLRDKKIKESVLDDIAGIGHAKKLNLLNQFDSFTLIKKASLKDLSKVKGINLNLAKKIYSVLH